MHHLLHGGVDGAGFVHQFDGVGAVDLGLGLKQVLDGPELAVVNGEGGVEVAPGGLFEADVGGLVPHDIALPQPPDQDRHVDRVHGAVDAAAEGGAHDIAGAPFKGHLHPDLRQVGGDVDHPSAGAPVGREEVEDDAVQAGGEGLGHGRALAALAPEHRLDPFLLGNQAPAPSLPLGGQPLLEQLLQIAPVIHTGPDEGHLLGQGGMIAPQRIGGHDGGVAGDDQYPRGEFVGHPFQCP